MVFLIIWWVILGLCYFPFMLLMTFASDAPGNEWVSVLGYIVYFALFVLPVWPMVAANSFMTFRSKPGEQACASCGSPHLFLAHPVYICRDCGYYGGQGWEQYSPEQTKKIEAAFEEWKKGPESD